MAPLTRRRKAAQQGESQETDESLLSIDSPRAKRKPTSNEETSTPTSSKKTTPKRQKLAVRVRDDSQDPTDNKALSSVRRTKRDPADSIADSEDDRDEADAGPTPIQVAKQLEEEATQQLSQELNAARASSEPATADATIKGKRIVFGDDADVEKYVAAAVEKAEQAKPVTVEDEEHGDSDDEAPEAVSTTAAAKESEKASQALTQAAERQDTTLKRKRQERDNLFKEQAQKRKRVTRPEIHQSTSGQDRAATGDSGMAEIEKAATSSRRRAEKFTVPSVLPAELLTDSESDKEDGRDLRVVKKPTKIKFEDALQNLKKEGRAPRDEIVGTTAYRVLADQSDPRLAPRANHNSKNVKEMLMRRRRVGVPSSRSKGFFKRR